MDSKEGGKEKSSASPLKVAIPIVALAGVVFGVTLMSQYAPKKEEDALTSNGQDNNSDVELRFGSSQQFLGFFEPTPEVRRASFWFENRNTAPVTVQLLSEFTARPTTPEKPFSSNNGSRIALISPKVTDQLIMSAIMSGFPPTFPTAAPMFAGTAANLSPDRLSWQELNPAQHTEFKVPAAPMANQLFSYQWGVLELQFRPEGIAPPTVVQSNFNLQLDGSPSPKPASLNVGYEVTEPCGVYPRYINIGELKESSDPISRDFYVFSPTRGPKDIRLPDFGDLNPPSLQVQLHESTGNPGPFISVSPPVRVTEPQEIQNLFESINPKPKDQKAHVPVGVRSAYRYTFTFRPRVGEERTDLGPLERDIEVTLPGLKSPKKLFVKGMVRGSVWLDNDRTDIDLPAYTAKEGTVQTIHLNTEQRDAEVILVPGECEPKFVQLKLTRLPPASDRGFYELVVSVPKNSQTGSWDGMIVLELKGSKPLRMRIPIRGKALSAR